MRLPHRPVLPRQAAVKAALAVARVLANRPRLPVKVEQHPSRPSGVTQLMAVGDYYKPVGEYTTAGLLMVGAVVAGTIFLLNAVGKPRKR